MDMPFRWRTAQRAGRCPSSGKICFRYLAEINSCHQHRIIIFPGAAGFDGENYEHLVFLMAEFNTPNIELSADSQKYFGMSPATAEAKANACKLPVPTYRIGTSQKAKRCINIQESIAEYIDKRREEGRMRRKRSEQSNRRTKNITKEKLTEGGF